MAKPLRNRSLPLSPLSEVEVFLDEFRSALARGEFDPYLYEFVEALDERVADRMQYSAEEPDAFVAAFLRRVRRLRVGDPELAPEACYSLLGATYEGVVVRYLEPHGEKIRVEVVQRNNSAQNLVLGKTYQIPATAIDRRVDEPEGK